MLPATFLRDPELSRLGNKSVLSFKYSTLFTDDFNIQSFELMMDFAPQAPSSVFLFAGEISRTMLPTGRTNTFATDLYLPDPVVGERIDVHLADPDDKLRIAIRDGQIKPLLKILSSPGQNLLRQYGDLLTMLWNSTFAWIFLAAVWTCWDLQMSSVIKYLIIILSSYLDQQILGDLPQPNISILVGTSSFRIGQYLLRTPVAVILAASRYGMLTFMEECANGVVYPNFNPYGVVGWISWAIIACLELMFLSHKSK